MRTLLALALLTTTALAQEEKIKIEVEPAILQAMLNGLYSGLREHAAQVDKAVKDIQAQLEAQRKKEEPKGE